MIRQYDAQKMCDELLKHYGLYDKGWRTCFSKIEEHLARCYFDEKRIQLSTLHLNSRVDGNYKDVILHEIAHALAGPGMGHGPIWKAKAIEIGAEPVPCVPVSLDKARSLQPTALKPKREYNRLNNQCPICNEMAVETSSITLSGIRWVKLKCGHLVKTEQIKKEGFDFSSWVSKSGKEPFPYQIEGIGFLERSGGRALIADEPGLGKTIQALGFLYAHKETVSPTLWVCKSTLKIQALKEALDWCGPEFMAQIIENPRSFILPSLKLYIISMDLLRNMPTEKLEKIGFKTVVADEIQHFKNPDSSRTAELRKLVSMAENFISLSGTPWKNRGQEYYPVLNMIDPNRFPSYAKFKNDWVDVYYDENTGKYRQGGIRNIPKFREYTKDIVIRRMRDDVLPDLPPINRQIRFIDMEAVYKESYEESEKKIAAIIKDAILEGRSMQSIGSEIMHLKHITGLAKVATCIDDVKQWLEDTEEWEKVTIFHHHIDVGNNLQEGDGHSFEGLDKILVEMELNKTLRLYGGRKPEERDEVITKFKMDPKCRVLIASTLASGEGLNIQFCQNAIMLERQWNPANEEQAEFRFSRPLTWGDCPAYLQETLFNVETKQPKKPSVKIPYHIAAGTVDEFLTDIVERKRFNFRKSMNDRDANIQWNEMDIIRELAEYIIKKRYGKVQYDSRTEAI